MSWVVNEIETNKCINKQIKICFSAFFHYIFFKLHAMHVPYGILCSIDLWLL